MFVRAVCIGRKVILMSKADRGKEKFIVIDHLRKFPINDPKLVIASYYPTVNNMILVEGSDADPWIGRVIQFDLGHGTLSVAFYVRYNVDRDKWVRESRRVDIVHLNRAIGIAQGNWIGTTFLAWQKVQQKHKPTNKCASVYATLGFSCYDLLILIHTGNSIGFPWVCSGIALPAKKSQL